MSAEQLLPPSVPPPVALRCDGCLRMVSFVERVALMVAGRSAVERDLCAACRSEAMDGFLKAAAR